MKNKNYAEEYRQLTHQAYEALLKCETEINRIISESYKFCRELPKGVGEPYATWGTPLECYLIRLRDPLDDPWGEVHENAMDFIFQLEHFAEKAD